MEAFGIGSVIGSTIGTAMVKAGMSPLDGFLGPSGPSRKGRMSPRRHQFVGGVRLEVTSLHSSDSVLGIILLMGTCRVGVLH